jgi:hypothetical protein
MLKQKSVWIDVQVPRRVEVISRAVRLSTA